MGKHLIVIGGGAAGFFCAINATSLDPTLKVTIIEKSNKLLSKVRVSGGGRCNVTHACFDIAEMSKQYPRGKNFVKKSFHQFFTTDTIRWFEERGVKLKTEADGRMFPVTNSSQTIIDCLLKEASKFGIEILMHTEVTGIAIENGNFRLRTHDSRLLTPDYLCIASGGYPKSSMFEWLIQTGHSIEEPVPSLFTFNLPKHPITELMGVSVENVRVKITGTKLEEEGPLLITHWGLSGPAILRLSAWGARELAKLNYDFEAHINWLWKEKFNEPKLRTTIQNFRKLYGDRKIISNNFGHLPQRLWQFLLTSSGINAEMRFADLPKKLENSLINDLIDFPVHIKGKTTFKEEFVTAGGIRLEEIDPNTMMSRKISNLFFAGEVMDVDGITGGFNFQQAWTSGFVVASSISRLTAPV